MATANVYYSSATPSLDYSFGPQQLAQDSTQAQLNAGLVCLMDSRPNSGNWTKCISSEQLDGRVRSWAELSEEMNWAATINPQFPESSRRAVWYANPSWHRYSTVYVASVPQSFAPDFKPDYIGPTTTTNNTTVTVIQPPPTSPTTTQAPTSPISPPSNIPIIGTVGGGTPIAGPLGSAPGSIPLPGVLPTTLPGLDPRPFVPSTITPIDPNAKPATTGATGATGSNWLWLLIVAALVFATLGG